MGVLEQNTTLIYGIHLRESANDGSDFTAAAADYRILYLGEDGSAWLKDSASALTQVGVGSGSSFPTGINTNTRFYRTDHAMEFVYDGTRWKCTCPHDLPFVAHAVLPPLSATAGNWAHLPLPISRGMDILVEAYECSFFVASGGTALGASHKWVGTVQIRGTGTTVGTMNIDSGAVDTWRTVSDLTDDVIDCTSAEFALSLTWTKTGTPGNLTGVASQITYRYIGV